MEKSQVPDFPSVFKGLTPEKERAAFSFLLTGVFTTIYQNEFYRNNPIEEWVKGMNT
ncbi:hypothetical protein [Bacillus salacetis]|uniref:hypothetical protein n=1 Tax=Bacillus salacetis TaxID=2315464 RepID=UPI001443B468|nr:hypothetical protein [Bacillus salacetis]